MKAETFTIPQLKQKKEHGEPITMITCYDHAFARILDACDIDVILVGDSLGMVMQGQDSTLPVTIDEMIYHTQCVRRGIKRSLLVTDMPFLSYQASTEEALRNAGRLLKEGGAQAVKLEGGHEILETTKKMVAIGIPVFGHIGLQPQSVHAMGGYLIQGKTQMEAQELQRKALALEEAGACSIILEGIPAELAQKISTSLTIPTIGIGSGPHCDGQVLVIHDLLGMDRSFKPRFVRRYAELEETIGKAVNQYARDVREHTFPNRDESFYLERSSDIQSVKKK